MRGVIHRTGEKITHGNWLVIIARHSAAEAESEQLEKEWKWLLHKAGLMRPKEEV
jgi:RNase P protein component|tara:strand:- start:14945 stop:15109 length:165 start_codon:yes stop_codon:yes gene_type:complete